jgi:thiamine-monophosphate kinase
MAGADEFEVIARLLRPLAEGSPESLNLMDDAALIPSRPGYDLVITKDVIVEGVHFLSGDPLDLVARKLLRVNLSDLAAKGAEPYGYLLACAWPASREWDDRARFAEGLATDQAAFGLKLFGGDTVSTTGPMVFSATMLGWVKPGAMVRRSGARPGDLVQVSGCIGDGWLGLEAARGGLGDLSAESRDRLAERYRLPVPRLDLNLAGAGAAADVSDGLIADAGHIATVSGVRIEIDLSVLPVSEDAKHWLEAQSDREAALIALATGGDDYQLVATAPAPLAGFRAVGRVVAGNGVATLLNGRPLRVEQPGYRHGNEA